MNRLCLGILLGASLALTSCGSGVGACIVISDVTNHCNDNYDASECADLSDSTFHEGKTCEELDYP